MKIALFFMKSEITISASSSFNLDPLDEIWNHFHFLTFLPPPRHPEVRSKKRSAPGEAKLFPNTHALHHNETTTNWNKTNVNAAIYSWEKD